MSEAMKTYISYLCPFKVVLNRVCKVRLLGYSWIKSENTTISVRPNFQALLNLSKLVGFQHGNSRLIYIDITIACF